jgi:hypothetical protein
MSTDPRPAESASYQHAQAEAAQTISQLQAPVSNHSKAMMAGPEGYSVADTCDPLLPSSAGGLATPAALAAEVA